MTTLPDVQKRLFEMADETGIDELRGLAEAITRRKPAKRAPPVSRTMTPELAEEVRRTAARFPHMTQHQVSVLCGVNQARVSEVLRGKRT